MVFFIVVIIMSKDKKTIITLIIKTMKNLERKSINYIESKYLETMKVLYRYDKQIAGLDIKIDSLDLGGLKAVRDVHAEKCEVLRYIREVLYKNKMNK